MKLEKNEIYYTPKSKGFRESWAYVLDINEGNPFGLEVEWVLYIIRHSGGKHLRVVDEKLAMDPAEEGVQESKPEDKRKLVRYIFKLPIDI